MEQQNKNESFGVRDIGGIVFEVFRYGIVRRPFTTLGASVGSIGGYIGSSYYLGQGEIIPTLVCMTVGIPFTGIAGLIGGVAGRVVGSEIDEHLGIAQYLDIYNAQKDKRVKN